MHQSYLVSSFTFVLACVSLIQTNAELEQCQEDCRQSPPFRLVGPTRPWHKQDLLGNKLGLTKSYPFAMAGSYLDIVRFNISYECIYEHSRNATISIVNDASFLEGERVLLFKDVRATLNETVNASFELEVLSFSVDNNENVGGNDAASITTLGIQMQVGIVSESELKSSHPSLMDRIEAGLKKMAANHAGTLIKDQEDDGLVVDRSIQISPFEKTKILHAGLHNRYSMFCELGCAYLFSSPDDPLHISVCTNRCDDYYSYNVTVGYNDLIEAARLECRDGCQIGLMRCRPGYHCAQVQLKEEEGSGFDGGWMSHCSAGTYRDISYDAVEECSPCPPGRFREDIKGRSLDGCSKCPAGTYNGKPGMTTMKDCHRCPAGTFTNEPGSASCICITPAACDNQFASPADAGKRDTIPFIGQW
jgi:hypothetical protein